MRRARSVGWILLIGAAALLPVLLRGAYVHHVLVMSLIFGFSALGLNLIFGFTGQAAFGLPAFFALGGYISALLSLRLGLPFWGALPGTMVIAAMFGFVVAYPSLHLRGIYFGITTMAFAQILYYIVSNWISLTRGPMGLVDVPVPGVHVASFDFEFDTGFKYYYLVLAAMVVTVWLIGRLMRTPLGRAFVAIRENEDLAASIGVHPFWTKMIAFMLACTITAIGGSFYAHFTRFMSPNEFQWYYIGLAFIMVIVGGLGTVMGPVIGAVVFSVLPEVFRALEQYRNILTGTVLVLVVLFFPEGIMGLLNRRRVRRKPEAGSSPSSGGEVEPA